jgi:hypothetical protein
MTNRFSTAGDVPGQWKEEYRFDPQSARWTWKAWRPDDARAQETGTSAAWTTDTWTFDGVLRRSWPAPPDSIGGPAQASQQIRMVYTALGENAFRRDFEVYQDGVWRSASGSTCSRIPTN